MGFVLVQELLSPGGGYSLIDDTVKKLEENEEVQRLVGKGKFAVYGLGDGHHNTRRRPWIEKKILADGRHMVDAAFYIEGDINKAKVMVEAIEQEDGTWKDEYLSIEVPGMPTKVLIQPVIKARPRNTWNPFSRFF